MHVFIVVAVFSLAGELFICGRVGTVETRIARKTSIQLWFDFQFLFLSARLSLRQMWLLSLLRRCFQVSSVWCFAMVLGGTGTMGLTPSGKEWHSRSTSMRSKRARGESMTSWINRSDEALMDMRKKLATAPGANSSESTMIPHGWLLLHRARLRDQDIVGVMTMTRDSLNIKLVEKSLLDLVTDDVLQSVDRSHGKDSGNSRKQQASEVVEKVPEDDDDTYFDDDLSANDDPYIDEDGNFHANEQIVSDIDDDLALDDEEYHEALLGYREARDLMKEARVARGFYLVVVPIRSLLAEEKVIPQVSKMCVARLVVARVEEDRKVLEDLPTLVAATERVKAEDVQELVMVHRVLKSVSSAVRMIIGP